MTSVLPSSAATVIFDNAGQELGTPLIPIDWSVFDFESPTDFTPPYIWSEDFSSIIGGDSPIFIEIGQADPNFVDLSIDFLTGQPLSELIDAHRQQVLIDSLISELAQSDPLEALNWLNKLLAFLIFISKTSLMAN